MSKFDKKSMWIRADDSLADLYGMKLLSNSHKGSYVDCAVLARVLEVILGENEWQLIVREKGE